MPSNWTHEVSVIIATRDRAGPLARTLSSLSRQEVGRLAWQVLVVDNGSSDSTRDVIDSFKGRLPLIGLNEPTPGKSRALNVAKAHWGDRGGPGEAGFAGDPGHGTEGIAVPVTTQTWHNFDRGDCGAEKGPRWLDVLKHRPPGAYPKRRGWDSNPRGLSPAGFQDRCIEPLCHPSKNSLPSIPRPGENASI